MVVGLFPLRRSPIRSVSPVQPRDKPPEQQAQPRVYQDLQGALVNSFLLDSSFSSSFPLQGNLEQRGECVTEKFMLQLHNVPDT